MDLVFDIETDGLDHSKIWCIVAKEVNQDKFHIYQPHNIEQGIRFLEKADTLIGHNIIGFDIPAMEKYYNFKSNAKIVDTLVMSRLFNPAQEKGHSLEVWGLKLNYPKLEQPETFDEYTDEMCKYCEGDVILNEKVYHELIKSGEGFHKDSIELEHKVAYIMKKQEADGFMLDEQYANLLLDKLNNRQAIVEREVQETFKPIMVDDKEVRPYIKKDGTLSNRGLTDEEYDRCIKSGDTKPFMRKKLQEFNLGSRKQIGERLLELGWKPKKFTPTGQPIVDEGTLSKVKHIKEAALITEFLLLQKRIAQITSWLDELKDDRVHGFVIPNGAVTGRMTHRKPNMAQVPSIYKEYGVECRSCWTVPKGYKLVGIDASGLELRMLAHYMKDEEYTNEIINGDIHTTNQELAALESRDQAKTFIYAFLYGAGDEKIGKIIKANKGEGKKLKSRFLRNLPSLRTLTERVRKAATRGWLRGLDGRKIYVRTVHASLNSLLQGGGAIVMKQAMVYSDQYIKEKNLDAKFVANIHDEWQLEVKDTDSDKVGELGVLALEKAGEHYNMNCPLTGEYKIGDNWSETH